MSKRDVVIVGAGVVGLSVALALSEKFGNSLNITLVAEFFPLDDKFNIKYCSPKAGAHFRPFPSTSESDRFACKLTRITQNYFKKLAKDDTFPIKFVKGIEYIENANSAYLEVKQGYSEDIENFQVLPEESLPAGANFGVSYITWVLNAPLYLKVLQTKLEEKGITFLRRKLDSLKEINNLFDNRPIIVNCSGNGLQYNGGIDPACFPIRGQTILIRPPENLDLDCTVTHQLKDGQWTFYIERPHGGGVIVGGTKQVGDTYASPRQEDTDALIQRASVLFPHLMKKDDNNEPYFDIIKVNVGFRPARNGGLNLSVEKADQNHVIHAYGAGGMGYELSYGIGHTVSNLMDGII